MEISPALLVFIIIKICNFLCTLLTTDKPYDYVKSVGKEAKVSSIEYGVNATCYGIEKIRQAKLYIDANLEPLLDVKREDIRAWMN